MIPTATMLKTTIDNINNSMSLYKKSKKEQFSIEKETKSRKGLSISLKNTRNKHPKLGKEKDGSPNRKFKSLTNGLIQLKQESITCTMKSTKLPLTKTLSIATKT